jgi:gliding motility-associated-like protein
MRAFLSIIRNICLVLIAFVPFKGISQSLPCITSTTVTVNPPLVSGGYVPGTVVTFCYTLNGYTQQGNNWFEGMGIGLGAGWLAGSLNPVTAPNNFNGGTGQWIWLPNGYNYGGNFYEPGYYFDLDGDGISYGGVDYGDEGAGPWTMCFSAIVGNTPGATVEVCAEPVSDGQASSWTSNACNGVVCDPVVPPTAVVIGCNGLVPSITNQIDVLCNGASTGSFTVSTANGNPPFTFSFQGGAFSSTNSFSNLAAGTYTVTIKDASNCTVPITATITQPTNALSVNLQFQNNVGCAGGSTGSYKFKGAGGNNPYTYSIDGINYVGPNNGNAYQANGLTAGVYNVWVKDANGCTATMSITITEPPPLILNIVSQTNPPCTGGGTGSITVAGSGGTPNYSYKLNTSPYQASGVYTNLAPGNYTIKVRDANNCVTTINVTIVQPSIPTGSVLSQTDVDCFGNANGVLNFQGANGTAPYTFSINGGAFASNPFNGLAAGNYNITVKEANGCTGSFTATVNQPNALSLAITNQNNIDCFGASNGDVTVTASNGTAPYNYTLGANSNTTGVFTNLPVGNNSFTVTDNHGCTANVVANITQPASGIGSLIVVQTNVLCSGTNTGSFTLQGNNGVAPYSFTLNGNTNSTGTFNNLAAGIYNVTVTDASGCTHIQVVNLNSPNALNASIASQTAVSCFGGNNASLTVTAINGTNPYNFNLGSTNNSTGIFNNLSAGSYNVIVSDQNGCSYTQPVTIIQPTAALSSAIANQTNVTCFGGNNGTVAITASNGTAPYTYQMGAITNSTGQFNTLASGAFTVLITDNNSCTVNQNVTITQPASLNGATISQTAVACFGNNTGQIQITGMGGTAPYSYSLGASSNSTGSFSNLTAGNYNFTITDNNSCTYNYAATIAQPTAALSASVASQTDVLCFNGSNGSVTINASNGTPSYQYGLTGTALAANSTISGLSAGNYSITVQDLNGCTVSLNATIIQPPSAVTSTIISTNDVLCFGNNTGAITIQANNGVAPFSYTIGTSTNTTGVFNNLVAGTYNINISDNNGCLANNTTTINGPTAALNVTIPTHVNPTCNGFNNGSANTIVSGGTNASGYTYAWNTTPVQNGAVATNLAAGTYTVTVTDDNLCVQTANVTLTEPNFQLMTNAAVTICDGETTTLNASSVQGAPPVTYTWTNMNNGSILSGSSINPSPSATVNYSVVATDNNGCLTTPSVVTINVNPLPVAAFTEDVTAGCQPLCVNFVATPTLPNTIWDWDFGDTQIGNGPLAINCFKNEGIYTVSLTATSDKGCSSTFQKSDLIAVLNIPKALFTAEPKETTLSNPLINFINQSTGADNFTWRFGDNQTSSEFEPNHSYTETGNYCIWMIAENAFGCIDSTQECIKIKSNFTMYIPNSFTPNDDGNNDIFIPLLQAVKDYEMNIYNRWGLKVFTSKQIDIGWNGGNEPVGAYNYVIQLTTITGEQKIYSGSITLYR